MRRKFDGRFNARKREALAYFGIESAAALVVALVINLCVLSVFARGFYGRDPPAKIGLENAGEYLGDTFGPVMRVIWAVGLLAAGAGTPNPKTSPLIPEQQLQVICTTARSYARRAWGADTMVLL